MRHTVVKNTFSAGLMMAIAIYLSRWFVSAKNNQLPSDAAMKHGASKEEIAEALGVAISVNAGAALVYSVARYGRVRG